MSSFPPGSTGVTILVHQIDSTSITAWRTTASAGHGSTCRMHCRREGSAPSPKDGCNDPLVDVAPFLEQKTIALYSFVFSGGRTNWRSVAALSRKTTVAPNADELVAILILLNIPRNQ